MKSDVCIVRGDGVIVGTVVNQYEDDEFEYRIKLRRTEYDKIVSDNFIYPYYAQPLSRMLLHLKSYYEANSNNCISSLRLKDKIAVIKTNIGWVEYYLVKV